jgi:hypothetical protein
VDARQLLEAERETERRFVAAALAAEDEPKGWPAALIMFHLARWRGRLRRSLTDHRDGRAYEPLPADIDAFNDAELPEGATVSLGDAASGADAELAALIGLAEPNAPFAWGPTNTSAEALLRNSYIHPRNHIAQYLKENGDERAAHELLEATASELREASVSPFILGAALYNLACVRAAQNRRSDALDLLEEMAPMRPDLRTAAARDDDLVALHGEVRFQAIVTPP